MIPDLKERRKKNTEMIGILETGSNFHKPGVDRKIGVTIR